MKETLIIIIIIGIVFLVLAIGYPIITEPGCSINSTILNATWNVFNKNLTLSGCFE